MTRSGADPIAQELINAAKEEFQALRAEVTARIQKQQDITNFALAAIAALVAVVKVTQGASDPLADSLEQLRAFIPFASIALSIFALMALDHEMNIAHISLYIHNRLRPVLVPEASTSHGHPMMWNAYRASWQQHVGRASILTSAIAGAKYAAMFLANVLLLVSFWNELAVRTVGLFGWAAYGVACVALLLAAAGAAYTSRVYVKMPHERTSLRLELGD